MRVEKLTATLWCFAAFLLLWNGITMWDPTRGSAISVFWRAGKAILAGQTPYDAAIATGSFVDPPSAVLVTLPFALLNLDGAHLLKLLIDLACVAGTVLLVCRGTFGQWFSAPAAAGVLVVAYAGVIRFVLDEGNWEPQLILAFAATVHWISKDRWLPAAFILGSTFAVKPILVPLLIVFLLERRWRDILIAGSIPLVLNLISYPLVPGYERFFTDVIPFLVSGQATDVQSFNVSIRGFLEFHEVHPLIVGTAQAAMVGLVAYLVWDRHALWHLDRANHVIVTETCTLLVLGLLLTFSYSFPHYTVYCLPLLLTVLDQRSSLRGPLVALAAVFILSWDPWRPSVSLIGELILLLALAWARMHTTPAAYESERALS